ncbi:MAG: M20/M25/M40 family metallo-hydrolase [Opitutae bacterium]|nr:M20/M25/M40 family metallo-hydrolase [Opitutae bacterium]
MQFPRSIEALLKELIAIPSVSPEGDAGGTTPGESAMADYVAELLRALGADVRIQEVTPGRANVIGCFAARNRQAPTLALVPHLDTVGVAGMTVPPFRPHVRNGKIYGRGACDTKGPMAAALWALRQRSRRHTGTATDYNIIFAATCGEEELSLGAKALCEDGFAADFAIALEPTDMRIVHAAKGVLRVWIETVGRAAHGSTPEQGRNAVFEMLPFLSACREKLAPNFATHRHPILGTASLNVGLITGGNELNVVPARCRVGLDIRTHPLFDNASALASVAAAAPFAKVQVHRAGPPFVVERRNVWLRKLSEHANGFAAAPWFSDANVLNNHGIPSVAFGPGSISQAHTADEFIEIAQLKTGARTLEAFLH